tara:strand:+ start:600 stop:1046 length:447 start_codon:yes stop_codon:yes gene_type:complete
VIWGFLGGEFWGVGITHLGFAAGVRFAVEDCSSVVDVWALVVWLELVETVVSLSVGGGAVDSVVLLVTGVWSAFSASISCDGLTSDFDGGVASGVAVVLLHPATKKIATTTPTTLLLFTGRRLSKCRLTLSVHSINLRDCSLGLYLYM